jgi:hypothetical protein
MIGPSRWAHLFPAGETLKGGAMVLSRRGEQLFICVFETIESFLPLMRLKIGRPRPIMKERMGAREGGGNEMQKRPLLWVVRSGWALVLAFSCHLCLAWVQRVSKAASKCPRIQHPFHPHLQILRTKERLNLTG